MGPESILLSVMAGGREGTYRFTCPMCTDAVEKRADRKIVALLVSAGVDVAGESEEGQAEFEAMTPRRSQHMPGEEIPEEHWAYRFAKKHWFFGFGAYS